MNKKERGGASYCSAGKLQPALLIGLIRALNKQRSPKGARLWVGTALCEQLGAGGEEEEEAEVEEEGLGGRMVSVGARAPPELAGHPPARPQAQGGALRLKPRRE